MLSKISLVNKFCIDKRRVTYLEILYVFSKIFTQNATDLSTTYTLIYDDG